MLNGFVLGDRHFRAHEKTDQIRSCWITGDHQLAINSRPSVTLHHTKTHTHTHGRLTRPHPGTVSLESTTRFIQTEENDLDTLTLSRWLHTHT